MSIVVPEPRELHTEFERAIANWISQDMARFIEIQGELLMSKALIQNHLAYIVMLNYKIIELELLVKEDVSSTTKKRKRTRKI